MFAVNKNPTRRDLRRFGVAMFIGFFFIGAIMFFAPWLKSGDVLTLGWTGTRTQISAVSIQALGLLLWILSIAAPALAKPIYVTWMSITVPIGIVMSTIMLTVLFFVLLPAFSLIVRRSDPLRKRLVANGSYWEDYKPHEATLDRMARPF